MKRYSNIICYAKRTKSKYKGEKTINGKRYVTGYMRTPEQAARSLDFILMKDNQEQVNNTYATI